MVRTAKSAPTPKKPAGGAARAGGEFFVRPTGPQHRRYEALRGYLYEGLTIEAAAARASYSTTTLRSAVRDFRGGKTGFFLNPHPGPTRAPAKNAARERIIELRRAGHSAKEIAEALTGTPTPLNRTGVAEVLAEAGFPRLPVRPPAERGAPHPRPSAPRAAAELHHGPACPRRDQGGRAAARRTRAGRLEPTRGNFMIADTCA